jgi:hypothetical protein
MNMADLGKIEYRVRTTTRYLITRYHEGADGRSASSECKGEYDNGAVAYEVAYALCKAEHERLGLPVGDERILYPTHPFNMDASLTPQSDGSN